MTEDTAKVKILPYLAFLASFCVAVACLADVIVSYDYLHFPGGIPVPIVAGIISVACYFRMWIEKKSKLRMTMELAGLALLCPLLGFLVYYLEMLVIFLFLLIGVLFVPGFLKSCGGS